MEESDFFGRSVKAASFISLIWEKMNRFFSKRPFGEGSLMIWGTFYWNGKATLIDIKGKHNATKYPETLENSLRPFIQLHEQDEIIFKRIILIYVLLSIHIIYRSRYKCSGLASKIREPESFWKSVWHPINVYLSKRKTVDDKNSLMKCMKKYYHEIRLEALANLTKSTQKRCLNILQLNGNACNYCVKYIWEKYESVLNFCLPPKF